VSGSIASATFQKQDDGSGQLCVVLLNGSSVVKQECTRAAYGVVSAAA
jgi:hypothetical protein